MNKLGWKDLTSAISAAGIPKLKAPIMMPFGIGGLREEYSFEINDYVFCQAFHVNHDIKVGGKAYPHVHWTTNGNNTAPVRWEMQIARAIGHNQTSFSKNVSYFVEQSTNGEPWRHMIAEVSDNDVLILTEPDELILITLRRVSNEAINNNDSVFGIAVDLHYESDRDTTPNKSPDFYK